MTMEAISKTMNGASSRGAELVSALAERGAKRIEQDLEKLRESAGKVVGRVFYGTLLKQMRESSFKTEIGHGGRGEEVFAAQLHELLAERMGELPNNNLADVLYKAYERQQRNISENMNLVA